MTNSFRFEIQENDAAISFSVTDAEEAARIWQERQRSGGLGPSKRRPFDPRAILTSIITEIGSVTVTHDNL